MAKTYDTSADFPYLNERDIYLDTACQSLRPQPVLDALNEYYTSYGSCGERVKYAWGVMVDEKVEHTRELVLRYLKLRDKDYFVSFTLNTSYGINLILNQIKIDGIKKVMTSDIEHNSPFLATIAFAKKHNLLREVMTREPDGSISLGDYDFTGALVVVNSVSNIDGRQLLNLDDLIKTVHKSGGIIIIDAAQAMAHSSAPLEKTTADAICFSAHKLYAPSLGVIVMRRDLLPRITTSFIGGGMVDDVTSEDSYILSADSPNHAYTKFEAGLQAWGEIIALGAAIEWLTDAKESSRIEEYANHLYQILCDTPGVNVINQTSTSIISWYHDKLDAHLLAEALSDHGIMTRSGYFCCHYYLDKIKHYPPLVRMSLGLHNKASDIDKVAAVLASFSR
ncbi:MAG: aminotransferase class V-fold PLP-dependent enzyme [Candidatus Nomurabacteria bacterium]|jgi:cysteine desulfurase/selenocysteine lyase|nr:aminotransferase class V-fold PLP-dependent enzyme [Candidatus Nomurabacteria bacterium]